MKKTMTILFSDGTRQEGITEITTRGCSGNYLHLKLEDGFPINPNLDHDGDAHARGVELIMVNND